MAEAKAIAPSFLRHFDASNSCDLNKFIPFFIDGKQLGWILKSLAPVLLDHGDTFILENNELKLHSRYNNFARRTEALGTATDIIAKKYGIGLRQEMYPIIQNWGDEPLAQIDRAAVPWLGVKGFGIHVNGFIRKPDGLYLWIGERAADRLIDPSKLDNMIGGGQPIGLTIEQNLCKEAQEEAGFSAEIAMTAQRVRQLSYMVERHHGLRNDVLFVFDLELSADTVPHNTDGEVSAFYLMPLAEVADLVHNTDNFKFNCNLVIIDFLIRHGFITASHAEYHKLCDYIEKPAIA